MLVASQIKSGFAMVMVVAALALSASGQLFTQAQTPVDESTRGISLQQQGKTDEALVALRSAVKRNKRDLRAWHYLGLAYERKGDVKQARKAHEKAAKLGDDLLADQLGSVSGTDYRAFLVSIGPSLNEAAASARLYIALNPKPSKSKTAEWSERAEYLADLAELANPDGGKRLGKLFTSKEVTTKVRILKKPEPQYTEEARQAQTTGTVVLRAILSSDGVVRAIVPVRSLPHGLTGKSIRAAHLIEFIPATVDGQPVSMFVLLEYNFNLY